ncbi:MAG TPA: FAD-dependent oxidoreductase [Opitutaceae bacterium]|nr:FAD-dependent oxidoreductase [Opitutaceae bacterium]
MPATLRPYYYPDLSRGGSFDLITADLCVYGGTAGGVVAAIAAAKRNLSVVLLEPGPRLGGVTSSGLGYTDIGNKAAIGGMAREFYRRVGRHYGVEEAWTFEPHVAERVFADWLAETDVKVFTREFLDAAARTGRRLTAVRMKSGRVVRAEQFIDASYEGDLLAAAGAPFRVGREDNALFQETLNGAQINKTHQFDYPVDPYVVPGDSNSGLLFGMEPGQPVVGAGDHRVQAYCFRVCLTDDPANRIPFAKPEGYDPRWYELLRRYFAAGWRDVFRKFDRLTVRSKTDTNNHGAVSTDFIGQNYEWPMGSYATREKIYQAHVTYQQGLHWYLANDPGVPAEIRDQYRQWGLCRDEFVETGGWPTQLYVREARRLLGEYVMTEHECRGTRLAPEPVGLAAYTMDSHNCRRFARDGHVANEGDVQEHGFPPYPIAYKAMVPPAAQCENLLVPVCLSATHIAYGSIRMEPVFMILGQSAATAAHIALEERIPLQAVPYADLRAALLKEGQILAWEQSEQPR